MPATSLFKKSTPSKKINAGGPSPEDQIVAMAKNEYWIVLNCYLLNSCVKGTVLCDRANALKHALQTYGPNSNNLPDLRQNEGKAKGHVFHGHVQDANGTTYVLEWAPIDIKNRIMALLHFDTHENYPFQQHPLKKAQCEKILSFPANLTTISYAKQKIEEAKAKVARVAPSRLI